MAGRLGRVSASNDNIIELDPVGPGRPGPDTADLILCPDLCPDFARRGTGRRAKKGSKHQLTPALIDDLRSGKLDDPKTGGLSIEVLESGKKRWRFRRRIAGSLHDGIVQDVSASSLLLAGAADRLRESPPSGAPQEVAEVLSEASVALRESVGSLRSLLVEIYPANLERAGLVSALADLAARLRPRGIDVTISVPDQLDVPLETATLLFRTAQEALLNVVKHAHARRVEVTLSETPDALVLEVTDDGAGFDLPATLSRQRGGHLGLSLLADLAAGDGATLDMLTAPGAGTCLRLTVPRT